MNRGQGQTAGLRPKADPAPHVREGDGLCQRGLFRDAAAAYRRAIACDPSHALAYYGLGCALAETGALDRAIAAFRGAIEAKPDFVEAHYNLGTTFELQERIDEAVHAYRRAVDLAPPFLQAQVNLGCALTEARRPGEAVEVYRQALAILPDAAELQSNLCSALLQAGDPAATLAACDAYLPHSPRYTILIACKAMALNELGRADESRALYDYDRFLDFRRIEPPAEFPSLAAFNAALAEHVSNHPSLTYELWRKANLKAASTEELLVEPLGPMAAFRDAIGAAVEDYRSNHRPDPAHPFLARPPERWRLNVWGTVVGAEGYQRAHIHPESWLSGVYYVQIPEAVGPADESHAGWIEFGPEGEEFSLSREMEKRAFEPEEGVLILFPSYFYHRTVPFDFDATRISIAFDTVLP